MNVTTYLRIPCQTAKFAFSRCFTPCFAAITNEFVGETNNLVISTDRNVGYEKRDRILHNSMKRFKKFMERWDLNWLNSNKPKKKVNEFMPKPKPKVRASDPISQSGWTMIRRELQNTTPEEIQRLQDIAAKN